MKRALVALLVAALSMNASAGALPVESVLSPKMTSAIKGVIELKGAQKGYAANDPVISGTESVVSGAVGALAGSAIASGLAAATAPAWVTAAAVAIGSTLVIYGVQAGLNWLFNSDGTVTITADDPAAMPASNVSADSSPAANVTYYSATQGSKNYSATSAVALGTYLATDGYYATGTTLTHVAYVNQYLNAVLTFSFASGATLQYGVSEHTDTPPFSCPTGQVWDSANCVGQKSLTGTTANATSVKNALTDAEKQAPLPAQNIANLANAAWQYAAQQPGYAGLPYDSTNPITVQDVQNWAAANASQVPTVGDALSPTVGQAQGMSPTTAANTAANPANQTTTVANPDGSTTTSGTQNVSVVGEPTVKLDLGSDPGLTSPTLEATPTWDTILAPIKNLTPSLKSFQVPNHTSTCYSPSVTLFGKSITFDSYCKILTNNADTIKLIANAIYALAGIFIAFS